MTVKEFGRCVWERSGGIIKEKQKKFKGVWSLKVQGNLQSNSGLNRCASPSEPRTAQGSACLHTHFAASMHRRDLITQHKINRTFMCRAETCVCSHA